jgi:hypothetical protein
MTATYSFRDGARFKANPQIIGEHLEMLRGKHGGNLSTDEVLKDAKRNNSPLHPLFEWDDSTAAREYRLWQARHIIGAVVVKYDDQPEQPAIRMFVNVRQEEQKQTYTSIAAALEDPELRRQVLADALRELDRIQRKYKDLTELSEIFASINRTREVIAA